MHFTIQLPVDTDGAIKSDHTFEVNPSTKKGKIFLSFGHRLLSI
jgi:hypothetical protein